MVVHKKAGTLTTSEKKNNIKKNGILNIEVSDKKKTNNISVGKKKPHFEWRSGKGVQVLKKKKERKYFTPIARVQGVEKKSVMF